MNKPTRLTLSLGLLLGQPFSLPRLLVPLGLQPGLAWAAKEEAQQLNAPGQPAIKLPPAKALAQHGKGTPVYQCPMHPQIIRDQPGQCPICHMTLVKVYLDAASEPAEAQVLGKAAFTLPTARQQLIGVKTVIAAKGPLIKTLRLSGRVSGNGVVAQMMEMDAGLVKPGQRAALHGPGGQELRGTVTAVEGSLDSLTRSFGVFVAPAQGAAWMRSGVFCEVRVEVPMGAGISLPADAVLVTGDQAVVFVRKDKERFEPRSVELGHQDDAWIEVTKGLTVGEEVVTGANFLIDSEARRKAAIEAFR